MRRPEWWDDGFDKDLYKPISHKVGEFIIMFLFAIAMFYLAAF